MSKNSQRKSVNSPKEKSKSAVEVLVAKYGLLGTIVTAVLGLVGVSITAYLGYLGIKAQIVGPSIFTQTAEAKLTTIAPATVSIPSTDSRLTPALTSVYTPPSQFLTSVPEDSDIRLVDVSVIPEGNLPALDIKVRNVGDQIALLKRAIIHVYDYEIFSIFGCSTSLEPTKLAFTAEYEVDLRSNETTAINLSQSVPPNDVDRFKIVLGTSPTHDGSWILYRLGIELIYNEDNQTVTSIPIIVTTPNNDSTRSARYLYGLGVTEKEIAEDLYSWNPHFLAEPNVESVKECFLKNLQTAQRIFRDEPFILSDQALREYLELQKVLANK